MSVDVSIHKEIWIPVRGGNIELVNIVPLNILKNSEHFSKEYPFCSKISENTYIFKIFNNIGYGKISYCLPSKLKNKNVIESEILCDIKCTRTFLTIEEFEGLLRKEKINNIINKTELWNTTSLNKEKVTRRLSSLIVTCLIPLKKLWNGLNVIKTSI